MFQSAAPGTPQAPQQLNKSGDFYVSPRHTVVSCFLYTSRREKSKENSSDWTIKQSADVGGLVFRGTLSLVVSLSPFPFLYQSCSVPNTFAVLQVGFQCKTIASTTLFFWCNYLVRRLFPHHLTPSVLLPLQLFNLKVPSGVFLCIQLLLTKCIVGILQA